MLLDYTLLGIVGMNVLAALLVLGRGPLFHTRLYRPMLLNMVLSVAPVVVLGGGALVIAALLTAGVPEALGGVLEVGIVLVWLLLLPNSGYLVTELNLTHRRSGDGVPEWYDVLLVLSLAMSGVLNMVLNVFLVQLAYVGIRFDDIAGMRTTEVRWLTVLVLLLAAFGVYLGRNIRLYSWDVVRPWLLVAKVITHLRQPGRLAAALGFTLVCGAFFALMYMVAIGPLVWSVTTSSTSSTQ